METWLKVLIAAACVVVIAGGGYYGIGEYREAQRLQAANAAALEQAKIDREAAQQAINNEVIADCTKRVPLQTTDALKALYQRCIDGL